MSRLKTHLANTSQFSTRHPNSVKAMANWERKSSYLLREIVKFRTYCDCLQAAQMAKEHIYANRTLEADKAEAGVEGEGASTLEAMLPWG